MPTGQDLADLLTSVAPGMRYVYGSAPDPSDPHPRSADCCLAGGSLVQTANRGPVPIVDVVPGDTVWAYDDGHLAQREVVRVIEQPVQRVYRLRTSRREVYATANHPFLRIERGMPIGADRPRDPDTNQWKAVDWTPRWARLDALARGDRLVAAGRIPDDGAVHRFSSGASTTASLCWALGLYVADGSSSPRDNSVRVCVYGETREALTEILTPFGRVIHGEKFGLRVHSRALVSIIEEAGLRGSTSTTKRLPPWLWKLPHKQIDAFLDGYLAGDGHIAKRDGAYQFKAANRELIEQIRNLYMVTGRTAPPVTEIRRTRPIVIKGRVVKDAKSLWCFTVYPNQSKGRGRYALNGLGIRRALPDPDLVVETVLHIEECGDVPTYDLTVEGAHSFLVDGLVVHNSGFLRWGYVRLTGNTAFPLGSATQADYCLRHGLGVAKDKAAMTPGAGLTRGFANGPMGHVICSRGNVGGGGMPMSIEAHSRYTSPNVGSWPIVLAHFDVAFLLPGLDYSPPAPPFPPPDWTHLEGSMACIPGDAAPNANGRWPFYEIDRTNKNLLAFNGATLQGSTAPFGVPFVHVPAAASLTDCVMSPRDDAVIVTASDGATYTYPR